eukprot:1375283-Amorphochlora_amoeboformis.AAC.1
MGLCQDVLADINKIEVLRFLQFNYIPTSHTKGENRRDMDGGREGRKGGRGETREREMERERWRERERG